ncbi:unnamed protein product [Tuber aestivum]|uniref:Integrase zinc-binding domain-containing protein n=1 Tax=Tuber aestivum TaxID=59557 RepID=A0A292PP67_9PEZI|nr:unnamed protein product [Tuber aestivum]
MDCGSRARPLTAAHIGSLLWLPVTISISACIRYCCKTGSYLLLCKNRWYIPNGQDVKDKMIEAEHDSCIAAHFGTYKTVGRVRGNFFWPKIDESITDYVDTCDVCQWNKSIKHKKFGLLDADGVPLRP